ncbi:MAG: helix-hairpin-helix domain-containing protein [Endomicrobia bacterium]|nr:helix-hairpin-helix domain-containing protein [Endomicrobiia bacterium]
MVVNIILSIFLFLCLSWPVLTYTNYTPSLSTNVEVSTSTGEEFTPEEEQILEEAYNMLDNVEQESVVPITDEEVQLLQEDEGFLEDLQRSPLDINTATYLQLKSIPGITADIAREIVRRRRTQPFRSKSELRKIRGVTEEIYKKISPYLKIYKVKQPAKLKGQIRIRTKMSEPDSYEYLSLKTNYVPVEKFRQPLYFYNRTQLSYGESISLGYVFLHRPMEIEVDWKTFQYFLRKWWLRINSIGPVDKLLIGNYKAGFGYGLVFHENYAVESLLGAVKPKMRGLREDKSTSDNAYLYGIGIEGNAGWVDYSIFYSNKQLITRTYVSTKTVFNENTGEKVVEYTFYPSDDILEIRNSMIEYDKYLMDYDMKISTSTFGRLPTRRINEDLVGLNLSVPLNFLKLGFCGYYAGYSKPFDPDKTKISGYDLVDKYSERWNNVYRGDTLAVYSVYFELPINSVNLYGEVGQSNAWFIRKSTEVLNMFQQGYGLNLGVSFPFRKAKFYFLYTYLHPKFYSPLGAPVKIYDYHNNQHGAKFGTEYSIGKFNINFSYSSGELFKGIWSGYTTSELPRYPSRYNEMLFECKYKPPVKGLEFYFRTIEDLRERYINLKTYNLSSEDFKIQTEQLRIRNRYQVSCELSKTVNLKFRYEQRWLMFSKYNKSYYGEQLWSEVRYKLADFSINSRFCVFNADKDIYLSYLEPQWYNLYLSETENNSSGDKFYVAISYKFTKNTVLWFRYRYKIYSYKNELPTWSFTSLKDTLGVTDKDFRVQLDISW